jgi:hypothetical protein
MSKTSLIALVLSASASCLGQVVIMGGTATTVAPGAPLSAAHTPLISTPTIALPGNGNAVGAPLSSAAENDSRSSSAPSVHNPNGPAFVGDYFATETQSPIPGTPGGTEGGALPPHRFENGIQHFESGLSRSVDHRQSLAEIALLYRGRQSKNAPRSFNNDNIAQLNERGVRTGNLGPETATVAHSFRPELMARNQAPALPQNDQEQFRRVSRSMSDSRPVGNQQRHATTDQSISTPDSDRSAESQPPTVQDKSIVDQSGATTNLPQRGSPLMFLIILTGLGVAGVLYWLKR